MRPRCQIPQGWIGQHPPAPLLVDQSALAVHFRRGLHPATSPAPRDCRIDRGTRKPAGARPSRFGATLVQPPPLRDCKQQSSSKWPPQLSSSQSRAAARVRERQLERGHGKEATAGIRTIGDSAMLSAAMRSGAVASRLKEQRRRQQTRARRLPLRTHAATTRGRGQSAAFHATGQRTVKARPTGSALNMARGARNVVPKAARQVASGPEGALSRRKSSAAGCLNGKKQSSPASGV
jgi:hypothetical protein